jgi:hypothetical protein
MGERNPVVSVRRERGEIGRGPVCLALRDIAALSDKAERKAHLLDRLDIIWAAAMAKTYVNKHGDEIACPDGAIAIRVVEVASELVDAQGDTHARRPVDLSVFNGGKSAAKAG